MPVHFQTHLEKGGHIPGILILRPRFPPGQIIEALELIWCVGT